MTRKITWFTALALGISTLSQAETATAPTVAVQPPVSVPADASVTTPMGVGAPQDPNAPVRDVQLPFANIAPPPGTFTLRGTRPDGQVEFGVRSDEVVSQAMLDLEFTPSPSLIPVESHVKVYLNDELMGVTTIAKEQLGKPNRIQMAIDPRYITDFNRVLMRRAIIA